MEGALLISRSRQNISLSLCVLAWCCCLTHPFSLAPLHSLGFDSATAPKAKKAAKEKETEAGRMLLGGGDKASGKKREYQTTTAGAVAAGHWDPWQRPVEFKMREVNRRVGGLYSMFVKGEAIGGTIPPSGQERAAAAAAPAAAAAASSAADKFNWKAAIRDALRAAPSGELKLKRLRTAVLKQHAASGAPSEDARQQFEKRLKKESGWSTDGKLVRLIKGT